MKWLFDRCTEAFGDASCRFNGWVTENRDGTFVEVVAVSARPNPSRLKRTKLHRGRLNRPMHNVVGSRHRAGEASRQAPFAPPEDWHGTEHFIDTPNYRVVRQSAGDGYRHVVTESDVRSRLAELPPELLGPLEVVQLSQMTRKKKMYPCYGMQWGSSLYLYPIEDSLVEYFLRPPKPNQKIEARMFGGVWSQQGKLWVLKWTEGSIRDFYLNNVLIHELGHLLDDRNRSYIDRERYAEWFAIHHGYRPSRQVPVERPVRRRHHSS